MTTAGTVTLLFTDIEGSTRLLEQLGQDYAGLLAGQQQILCHAFEKHAGRVVDTQGDSFFVAFPRAADAARAAVDAQRALNEHAWPGGVSVRVRMGLHTGEPSAEGDRYIGLDVHRAARIGAAAHGGQVLLSQTTRELVAADLPAGVSLRDLGEHRLKDLRLPRHLFQLVIAGLPSDFPPLRSLDSLPNNLPIQLTSFVGREREIAELKGLLGTTRLLTLTGVGGAGKTRLALQVVGERAEQFRDGVWYVGLDSIADPQWIGPTLAATLGLRDEAADLGRHLVEYLSNRQLLLLFDNCEHLINACADWADRLLHAAPLLKILATSREALGIAGETAYTVPSLGLPEMGADISLASLLQNDSVSLFLERAAAVSRDFRATEKNAPYIAQICRRLDGIPLALELAAARVKALTVQQIAARLDDVFRLLSGGSRTALPRQQTLNAAIDWSYNLLSPAERLIFQRLSVFSGGFTLEAAEEVCAGEGIAREDVLDLLSQLVNKSLVVVDRAAGDEARYSMLETIRQFARYRLFQSEAVEAVSDRQRDWCLDLAERAAPELRGHHQLEWLNRLETEHDNLRAALTWSLEREQAEPALRLAGALFYFWWIHGHLQEGRQWLRRALELAEKDAGQQRSRWRAWALLGDVVLTSQLWETAHEGRLTEALEIFREQGDSFGVGYAMWMRGGVLYDQMNYAQAYARLEESLKVQEATRDQWGAANSLHFMAHCRLMAGDYSRASELFDRSLRILVTVGDRWVLFHPRQDSAALHWWQGDIDTARTMFEEILAAWQELGNRREMVWTTAILAQMARDQGDFERAHRLADQALRLALTYGDYATRGSAYFTVASLARYQADLPQARTYMEKSVEMARASGDKGLIAEDTAHLGMIEVLQGEYVQGVAHLQEGLAVYEGGNMSPVIYYGLGEAARRQGDWLDAVKWHGRLLLMLRMMHRMVAVPKALEALAKVAVAQGEYERAARLLGAAAALRERMGVPLKSIDRAEHDSVLGELERVAPDAFKAQFEIGRRLTADQAIAYALNEI